jgi:hypothetical protein
MGRAWGIVEVRPQRQLASDWTRLTMFTLAGVPAAGRSPSPSIVVHQGVGFWKGRVVRILLLIKEILTDIVSGSSSLKLEA